MENIIRAYNEIINVGLKPLLVVAVAFVIAAIFKYWQDKQKNEIVCVVYFKCALKTYLLALIFSIIYICVSYLLDGINDRGILAIIYSGLLIYLIIYQTNSSYEPGEGLDGISGAITYFTATLSPWLFEGLYLASIFVLHHLYTTREYEKCRISRNRIALSFIENLLLALILYIFKPASFSSMFSMNCYILSAFTILLPLVNDLIYPKFDYYLE